jgi:hypothetical protein
LLADPKEIIIPTANITNTTPEEFILILTELEALDDVVLNLSRYCCENAVLHSRFIGVLPSIMARAGIETAKVLLSKSQLGTYRDSMVRTCMEHMLECLQSQPEVLIRKVLLN